MKKRKTIMMMMMMGDGDEDDDWRRERIARGGYDFFRVIPKLANVKKTRFVTEKQIRDLWQ